MALWCFLFPWFWPLLLAVHTRRCAPTLTVCVFVACCFLGPSSPTDRRALYTVVFDLRHVERDEIDERVQFWVDCVQSRCGFGILRWHELELAIVVSIKLGHALRASSPKTEGASPF